MKEGGKGRDTKELIFVYNVDSNPFNRIMDFAHKAIMPETYACNLCKVTHGIFTMHREWADFIKVLPYKIDFQYKDQWKGREPDLGFPVILLKDGVETKILLTSEKLNKIESMQELIDLIKMKLPK